jgi:N-acetylneuraminic acid mutarotase
MNDRCSRPEIARLVVALSIALGASAHATTPTFTPTGSMHVARAGHEATLLLDGRVLVTGGYDNSGIAVAEAEIFDAATGTWSATASNAVARMDHAATSVRDGRVLVVGGASSYSSCSPNTTAETYDPRTGVWSLTRDLPITVGSGPIAVALRDGRVLVAGGSNRCGEVFKTAALFNPSTNTWSATASMNAPRAFHSAVLLADGRVLVTGGTGGLTTGEVYDPTTATWTELQSSSTPRGISCGGYAQTFLSILQSGSVLAAGGISDCASGRGPSLNEDVDLFDPSESRWSPTGKLQIARAFTTGTALPDGTVLVVGGYAASGAVQSSTEFFNPADGGWNLIGALHTARAGHTATRLANGTVLIAGGSDAVARTNTAEIYVPEIAYAARGFGFPRDRPDRTGEHFFGSPWGVATNAKGHVYISYAPGGERMIVEWLPDAVGWKTYIREIGPGLGEFHSVRVDNRGNLWAVGQSTNTIIKFDPEGRVLLRFGRRPPSADDVEDRLASGAPMPYLEGPTDITWDQVGNIFVSDGERRARIVKYDASGHFIKATGSPGSAPGEMQRPHSIAADAKGHIYVADGGNARIQVFDNNLNLLAIYDAIGQPWAVCITPGPHQYLYTSSNPDKTDATRGLSTGEVYKLELDGTVVGKLGRIDNPPGNFRTLHAIDCRDENAIVATQIADWAGVVRLQP